MEQSGMSRAVRALAAALVTVKLVEAVKSALPGVPPPWQKSLAATLLSIGLTWRPGRERIGWAEEAGIAAGLAPLLHDAQTCLQRVQDARIAGVVVQAARSRVAGLPG